MRFGESPERRNWKEIWKTAGSYRDDVVALTKQAIEILSHDQQTTTQSIEKMCRDVFYAAKRFDLVGAGKTNFENINWYHERALLDVLISVYSFVNILHSHPDARILPHDKEWLSKASEFILNEDHAPKKSLRDEVTAKRVRVLTLQLEETLLLHAQQLPEMVTRANNIVTRAMRLLREYSSSNDSTLIASARQEFLSIVEKAKKANIGINIS